MAAVLLKRMEGNRANNFDSLYKKWLEVFDVKLLSKRFYDELFEWYQWAMSLVGSGRMHFPAWPKDGHGNESRDETVIRIITRMLFIWFIKEKGLIPASLFNKRELMRIVKDLQPRIVSQSFDNTCQIQLAIRRSDAPRLRERLTKLAFDTT